jgi:hydroxylamine reductase
LSWQAVTDVTKTGSITQISQSHYLKISSCLPTCAKYRYNKLNLEDIDEFPRVLDAGQCNDSFSLIITARGLVIRLGFIDVNEAPISYNIAWYEQKTVLVLLTLLRLGIQDITLGPKLLAFISPNVLNVLVNKFNITPNTTAEEDMERLLK